MNKIYEEHRVNRLYEEDRMLGAYGIGGSEGSVRGLDTLMKEFGINKNSTIVEIGSFAGVTSELFALRCKKVYCIDPWGTAFERDDPTPNQKQESGGKFIEEKLGNGLTWKENVEKAEGVFDGRASLFDNIIKIKNFSHEAAGQIEDESVDLLYLDGRHNLPGVRADMLDYYPKLKTSGVLAGHDYNCRPVRRCVLHLGRNFLGRHKRYRDGSWALRKKEGTSIEIPEDIRL